MPRAPVSDPKLPDAAQQNGANGFATFDDNSHSSGSPPTTDGRLWPEIQPGQFAWDQNIMEASSASCDFSHLTDLDDIFTFTGNSFLPPLPPTTVPPEFPLPTSTYPQQQLSPAPLLPGPITPLPINGGPQLPPRSPSSTVHIPGLNPRDQEYLRAEGCFDIPPPHVLRPMMRMYFRMVHPNLAIVEEDQFWARWHGDEFQVREFSFLLLRSMIFAATSYIELEMLSTLGFVSKREARNTHYRQAKVCNKLRCSNITITDMSIAADV